jgi:hypothetical protein
VSKRESVPMLNDLNHYATGHRIRR